MAEIRHACEDGLTAGCFAAYPQFAKKVFAYRLMHTLCPARMTKKLRESLWRALVRFPISWIPFEYFIFPPGFNTKLLFPPGWKPGDPLPPWIVLGPGASFPPDWHPGDPLPLGVTVDLAVLFSPDWTPGDPLPPGIIIDPVEIFPPGWTPGDPLPPWIVLGPGASFPPDWRPGDPLPPGVTVDLSVMFSPGWTPDDPLPPGIIIDPVEIFPPDWTPEDPLPYGITVDPEYRIQIPQLKLMYIYIEPGKTWEQVFPNGWDPTGPLPEGASWNPYLVFPGYVPAVDPSIEPLTPAQEQEAVYRATGKRPPIKAWTPAQRRRGFAAQDGTSPPLYMGPWEPGPVHRPYPSPLAVADYWESWSGPAMDSNHKWIQSGASNTCGSPIIVAGKLTFDCDNPNAGSIAKNVVYFMPTDDWPGAAVIAGTTLVIKVSANVSSDANWGAVGLNVCNAAFSVCKFLIFARGASYGLGADDVDVGDNGGAEMSIDLTTYGINDIGYLDLEATMDPGNLHGHADYEYDYIHFV